MSEPTVKSPELQAAELRKIEAEVAHLEAQTAKEAADARKAVAEAVAAESALKDVLEQDRRAAASDDEHRIYSLSEINGTSVRSCLATLARWHRLDPACDITIVFNSPGGSVIDGFALWDYLTFLKRQGHRLTTICQGMAASMGSILFQAGDERIMGAESVILVHEISFGTGGKIGEVEDTVEFAKLLERRAVAIFARTTKLNASQIRARQKRKDWWMDSDEALKLGFCDTVR